MQTITRAAAVTLLAACARDIDPVAPRLANDTSAVNAVVLYAPRNVWTVVSSSTQITVNWRDDSILETAYELYRSPTGNPGSFALHITVAQNTTTYRDTGLTPATRYCYQVRAVRDRGPNTTYSEFSPTGCATTAPGPSITVVPESSFVIVGGITSFRAEVRDDFGVLVSAPVTWTTSDPAVATVSATGIVNGLTRGRAIITATSGSLTDGAGLSVLSPLHVTTSTTGVDLDGNGYYLCIDGTCAVDPLGQIATNGAINWGLAPGDHLIGLANVSTNCSVTGEYPRRVNVNPDQDPVVTFDIVCSTGEAFAFAAPEYCYDSWCGWSGEIIDWYIALGYTNDAPPVRVVDAAREPAWSPDGRFIAFASSAGEIGVVNVSTGVVTTLTHNTAYDWSPDWSPDGSRIVFVSTRDGPAALYVMNADGSNPVRLMNVVAIGSPSWSPDGNRIAGTCIVDAGNVDICAINVDGSGFARLTTDPALDQNPDWSPDGRRIAFETGRYFGKEIALMNADGSGFFRLAPGVMGDAPAWSPDGSRIAFGDNYNFLFVSIIKADGTGLKTGVLSNATDPAWRPRTP